MTSIVKTKVFAVAGGLTAIAIWGGLVWAQKMPLPRMPAGPVIGGIKGTDPAVEAEADRVCDNWGFENGLTCWTVVPNTGNAFSMQPTLDDNVLGARVLTNMELAKGGIGGDYWKQVPYPIGGVKRALQPASAFKSQKWIGTYEARSYAGQKLGSTQGDSPTGELRSKPFRVRDRYASFLVGGGAGGGVGVEIHVPAWTYGRLATKPKVVSQTADGWYVLAVRRGVNSEIMSRATVDFSAYGMPLDGTSIARFAIIDRETAAWGHVNADDFRFSATPPPTIQLSRNGVQVDQDVDHPLWGFADTHAHPTNQLGFGGKTVIGATEGPMSQVFADHVCGFHDGAFATWNDRNHQHLMISAIDPHLREGWPTFEGFPKFNSKFHQQMHVDWMKRAYDGGQRLMVVLGVTNMYWATREAGLGNNGKPLDDETVALAEVQMMREIASRNGAWMEIANSAADARRIVANGKLAVVLGLEIDNFGNFKDKSYKWVDRAGDGKLVALPDDAEMARVAIRAKLDRYYQLGIRQVTPLHYISGVFGGTAAFHWQFTMIDHTFTGKQTAVEDGSADGIHFNIAYDGAMFLQTWLGAAPGTSAESFYSCYKYKALACADGPGNIVKPDGSSVSPEGKCCQDHVRSSKNVKGLTRHGEVLMQEIMRSGMMLDLEHASVASTTKMIELAKRREFPVMSSHTDPRALGFKPLRANVKWMGEPSVDMGNFGTSALGNLAHEGMLSDSALAAVEASGGTTGSLLFPYNRLSYPGSNVPNDMPGSSKTWANQYLYTAEKMRGHGLALSTDRGFNDLIAPRFGPHAGYSYRDEARDDYRKNPRMPAKKKQRNGVRYDTDRVVFQAHRYETDDIHIHEEDAWKAVAWYAFAKVSPHDTATYDRLPENQVDCMDRGIACKVPWSRETVSRDRVMSFVRGLTATSEAQLRTCCGDTPYEEAAMYAAVRLPELTDNGLGHKAQFATLFTKPEFRNNIDKIFAYYLHAKPVYDIWKRIPGANEPLRKRVDGSRDWDFNIDGMAHVGLIPDFLQDLINVGLTGPQLKPLFNSAEDYIMMWERAEASQARSRSWRDGTNIMGNDIVGLDLTDGDPAACAAACKGNAQCKAWSYVKPGVQGPQAKCWLKHTVGAYSSNPCCTTGTP
ncbi:MAG: PAN domain-containing protein [Kofleriaceae bacterium]|nr:PAN domain-containing protein [Kofleriaceae bacterium]